MEHSEQADAFAAVEYVAAEQLNRSHDPDEPAGTTVPGGQGVHGVAGFMSSSVLPAGQRKSTHDVPVDPWEVKVPGGHAVHCVCDGFAIVPAGHSMHGPAPDEWTIEPFGQVTHAVVVLKSKSVDPVGHKYLLHGPSEPAGTYVPDEHWMQVLVLVSLTVPAVHSKHWRSEELVG